jgi:glycosyltransferase involved in cell wall biosynthesis
MRVLHVGKFFPPHPGGIERCTADLCAALHAHGVDSAVLAHAEPGSAGRQFHAADGYEVTLAACHGRILYAPLSPAFPRLLHRVLGRWRPDLLHLHVPNTSAFWALLSPAARRLPWIVHWHADIPFDTRRRALRAAYRFYRPWEQALLRRCAGIIATSQAYADSSAALAPWRSKTHVIALGIRPLPTSLESSRLTGSASEDATAVQSHPLSPTPLPQGERGSSVGAAAVVSPDSDARGGLRLLTVGRLSYFKGIDVLLRALVDVPGAQLTIIGDGECRDALERLARELAIQARVAFAGRIDMDGAGAGAATIAEAYAQCDVFCLPSTDRAESFGLVLLEAMRAQRAIVASAIPGSGVGHVVRDGETGLLVPPGDAAALAAALRRLGDDVALRERLAAAGRRRWQAEFTLERSAQQVLQLYRSLM